VAAERQGGSPDCAASGNYFRKKNAMANLQEHSGELANVESVGDVATAKRFSSKVAASLGPYLDSDFRPIAADPGLAGYVHWQRRFAANPPPYPGAAYALLHSL
jgi:hypothetical protein